MIYFESCNQARRTSRCRPDFLFHPGGFRWRVTSVSAADMNSLDPCSQAGRRGHRQSLCEVKTSHVFSVCGVPYLEEVEPVIHFCFSLISLFVCLCRRHGAAQIRPGVTGGARV